MPPQFDVLIYAASIWVIPLIIAITFHEAAHGYVAHFFGDTTAWQLGRVTLNPFKHIDPVGTILLPALLFVTRSPFLFGYAKPVPVNFRALRNPRRDMIWVAAAGLAGVVTDWPADARERIQIGRRRSSTAPASSRPGRPHRLNRQAPDSR